MDELTSQFPYEIGIDFKYIETIDHGAFGTKCFLTIITFY